MDHEIEWTAKRKKKLAEWRGSSQRPKSVRAMPITSGDELEDQDELVEVYIREVLDAYNGISKKDQKLWAKRWLAGGCEVALERLYALDVKVQEHLQQKSAALIPAQVMTLTLETLVLMRRQMIALDDESYEALVMRATEMWSQASLDMKVRLAYLFPAQQAWGNQVIDMLPKYEGYTPRYSGDVDLTKQTIASYSFTLGSGADRSHMIDCAKKACIHTMNQSYQDDTGWTQVFSLLERFDVEAKDILLHLAPSRVIPVIEALSWIPHVDVAETFAIMIRTHHPVSKYRRKTWGKYNKLDIQEAYLLDHAQLTEPVVAEVLERDMEDSSESGTARLNHIYQQIRASLGHEAQGQDGQDSDEFIARSTLPGVLSNPPWRSNDGVSGKKAKTKHKPIKSLELIDDEVAIHVVGLMGSSYTKSSLDKIQKQNAKEGRVEIEENVDELIQAILDATDRWKQEARIRRLSCPGQIKLLTEHPDYLGKIEDGVMWGLLPSMVEDDALLKQWLRQITQKDKILEVAAWGITWSGLAPLIAPSLGTKNYRDAAVRWIKKNPKEAVLGGVWGYATSRSAKQKTWLEDMLRLAHAEAPELFTAQVSRYSADVQAMLPNFENAAGAYPQNMPKLPVYWTPTDFPPILLKNDPSKKLPIELYEDIGLMLKFSPPGEPYVGLEQLQEIADELSLSQFVWALFEAWIAHGCDYKEDWVFRAVSLFGGASVVERLPGLLMDWIADSRKYLIGETLIRSLSKRANDSMLQVLWRVHHGGRSEARHLANYKLKEVLKLHNIEDLEPAMDRRVPTLGLQPNHTLKLGEHKDLRVWFDQNLEPHLPRGTELESDVLELRWTRLQQLGAHHGRFVGRRMEYALRTFRRWPPGEWQKHICQHPLTGLVASNLLWGLFKAPSNTAQFDELHIAFRIDEEGNLVDLQDEPVTLDETYTVGLVHPLDLSAQELKAWTQIFADYEIIQPFSQLARLTYTEDIDEMILHFSTYQPIRPGAWQTMFEQNAWREYGQRRRTHEITNIARRLKVQHGPDVAVSYQRGKIKFNYRQKFENLGWGRSDKRDLSELFLEMYATEKP